MVRRRARTSTNQAQTADDMMAKLAFAHGAFYLATGIWPIVSIRAFEAVTGPKTDRWLVKTAGVLITVIGGALTMAGWRKQLAPELPLLAIGSAAGLTAIDVVYVSRNRISPVYLLDAATELALIAAWLTALRQHGEEPKHGTAPCAPWPSAS